MMTLFLLLLFLAVAAALWFQGLWNNAITLVNVIVAAMVATNYYEPLAGQLAQLMPALVYFVDFLVLWLLFVIVFGILRLITEFTSRERVRFQPPVELAGRSVLAVLVAWVIVCFTAMTLHTAPLPALPFGGAWRTPSSGCFLGLAPDRQWLAFIRLTSNGSLATINPNGFDPSLQFVVKHHHRRKNLEALEGFSAP